LGNAVDTGATRNWWLLQAAWQKIGLDDLLEKSRIQTGFEGGGWRHMKVGWGIWRRCCSADGVAIRLEG
jgi:hypothetical protein